MHFTCNTCTIRSSRVAHFMSASLTCIKDQIIVLYHVLACNSLVARQICQITLVNTHVNVKFKLSSTIYSAE